MVCDVRKYAISAINMISACLPPNEGLVRYGHGRPAVVRSLPAAVAAGHQAGVTA